MPIQVKIKTFPFKDEDGNLTDADFTIRTSLSHNGRNAYMRAVGGAVPDISEAVGPDGTPVPGYRPKVDISVFEEMEKVLLQDALVDLRGVQDRTGKEIKVWEEFLSFDSFYVSQVTHLLMEIAAEQVKKGTPSPKKPAPSA